MCISAEFIGMIVTPVNVAAWCSKTTYNKTFCTYAVIILWIMRFPFSKLFSKGRMPFELLWLGILFLDFNILTKFFQSLYLDIKKQMLAECFSIK